MRCGIAMARSAHGAVNHCDWSKRRLTINCPNPSCMTTLGVKRSSSSMACRRISTSTATRTALPCHNHCNQTKGERSADFVPGIKAILDRLKAKARQVERVADSVALNVAKDKVFKAIFTGLEKRTITLIDLDQLLQAFVRDPAKAGVPDDVIILDSGHWVPRDSIVQEGTCRCERPACVGRKNKVYCYFEASLSPSGRQERTLLAVLRRVHHLHALFQKTQARTYRQRRRHLRQTIPQPGSTERHTDLEQCLSRSEKPSLTIPLHSFGVRNFFVASAVGGGDPYSGNRIVELASDLLAKALRGNYPVTLDSMEGFVILRKDRQFASATEILSVVEPMLVDLEARLSACEATLK